MVQVGEEEWARVWTKCPVECRRRPDWEYC